MQFLLEEYYVMWELKMGMEMSHSKISERTIPDFSSLIHAKSEALLLIET